MNKRRVVSHYIAARDNAFRNGESVAAVSLASNAGAFASTHAKRMAAVCEVLNQDESSESLVNSAA